MAGAGPRLSPMLFDHAGKDQIYAGCGDLSSFAKEIRTYCPHKRPTSSVYSVPATQAIDRGPKSHVPDSTQQRVPMRVITRHGKVMSADKVSYNAGSRATRRCVRRRSSQYFNSASDRSSAAAPFIDSATQLGEALATFDKYSARHYPIERYLSEEGSEIAGPRADLVQKEEACMEDRGTQTTFLENFDQEPRPLKDLTLQDIFHEPIAVSTRRYVVPSSDTRAPGRRPSLVRRLSDSVKGAFRRRPSIDKCDIFRPRGFQDRDPRHHGNGGLHAEIKGIPSVEPQSRAANVLCGNMSEHQPCKVEHPAGSNKKFRRELPLRVFSPEEANPDDSDRLQRANSYFAENQPAKQRSAFSPSKELLCGTPSVRVVGDQGRDTVFGDFIDVGNASYDRSKSSADRINTNKRLPPLPLEDQYHHPELAPEPLHVTKMETLAFSPVRKESLRKRVDTSAKSWMPPDHSRDAQSNTMVSSTLLGEGVSDRGSWVGDLTLQDIFDPVEDIIDAYAHSDYDAEENDEIEIVLDTFDRGSHCSWIKSRRPKSGMVGSDHSHFDRQF